MTTEPRDELSTLRSENSRLKAAIERYRAPFRRAETLMKKRGFHHSDTSPQARITDLEFALAMEQAKSSTLDDVSGLLLAELQQLIQFARNQQTPTDDALTTAQEAVDLIKHLQTLWPSDESQN